MSMMLILGSWGYCDWAAVKGDASDEACGGGEPSAEQLQAVDLANKMFLSQSKGDA